MYKNKNIVNTKIVAIVAMLAMVFAGVAIISVSDDSSAAATELGVEIKANQSYESGNVVIAVKDLVILDGVEVTIGAGAEFIVNEGVTLTVNKNASLKIENGARVVVNGSIVLKEGSTLSNNAIFDNTNKVNGGLMGFFVNGTLEAQKGSTINNQAGAETIISPSAVSGNNPTSIVSKNSYDQEFGEPITVPNGTYTDGVFTFSSDEMRIHMNGAGNYGAWTGVTVTFPEGFDASKKSTVSIDGRTSSATIGATEDFYVPAGKVTYIQVTNNGTTYSFAVDAKSVVVPYGQMIINGTMNVNSNGSTISTVNSQIISMTEDSKVTLKGSMDDTIIWSFSTSDIIYTYGAICIISDDLGDNKIKNVTDLSFSVVSEKIQTAYVSTENGEKTKTNKAYNLALSMEGTITGAKDTDSITSAIGIFSGAAVTTDKKLWYADGDEASDIQMLGKVIVGKDSTLKVTEYGAMVVEGNLEVNGTITVKGNKDVEEKATFNVTSYGTIYVSGSITIDDVSDTETQTAELTQDGSIIIVGDGIVSVKTEDAAVGDYKGVKYSPDDYTYITSLKNAISGAVSSDATDITIAGLDGGIVDPEYIISESELTIPELDVTIKNVVIIAEGSIVTISEDASIEADAVSGGLIKVDGVLFDYTMTELGFSKEMGTPLPIDAEVKSVDSDETYYKYTTLLKSLSETTKAETISLFGDVTVEKDLTIPANITIDSNNKDLVIKNDATLTVNGIIDMSKGGDIILETDDSDETKDGKIVINNFIVVSPSNVKLSDGTTENVAYVAGVYADGKIGDYTSDEFILAPSVAATNSKTINSLSVKAETVLGDLILEKGDSNIATLDICAKATAGTITLKGYELTICNTGNFTGKIASTDGTISLKSIVGTDDGTNAVVIVNETNDENGADIIKITGKPIMVDKDGNTANVTTTKNVASISIETGKIKTGSFDATNLKSFSVTTGTELIANGELKVSKLTIEGTVTVVKDASINATGAITVVGTLSIDKEGAVSTTDMFVGMKSADLTPTTSAASSISGIPTLSGILYVANGSTLDENLVKALEDKKSTKFMVEGAEWFTAYDFTTGQDGTVEVTTAPITDADFLGWTDKNGNLIPTGSSIIISNYETLTAKIDYNIYDVIIVADNGIGSVYLDGVALIKNNNAFYAYDLKAGSHTITFELKNGYIGAEDVKMLVDGKAVSGYSFTLSGTDDTTCNINLSGTTPGVTPTEPTTSDDDGMGITDYLLIVLVVMVVILAIIVCVRMMRS